MNSQLNFLTNNYYKLLEIIYDNQIIIDNESYCPLTQNEISKILKISRNTIGIMIKELYKENLLIKTNNTKKYILSDNAKKIIKTIKKI